MAFKIKSDLRDNVDWDRKWFVDLNAGKTLFLLTGLITGAIHVNMDGSVLEENHVLNTGNFSF